MFSSVGSFLFPSVGLGLHFFALTRCWVQQVSFALLDAVMWSPIHLGLQTTNTLLWELDPAFGGLCLLGFLTWCLVWAASGLPTFSSPARGCEYVVAPCAIAFSFWSPDCRGSQDLCSLGFYFPLLGFDWNFSTQLQCDLDILKLMPGVAGIGGYAHVAHSSSLGSSCRLLFSSFSLLMYSVCPCFSFDISVIYLDCTWMGFLEFF